LVLTEEIIVNLPAKFFTALIRSDDPAPFSDFSKAGIHLVAQSSWPTQTKRLWVDRAELVRVSQV
jgi:hypothetical protein